MLKGLGGLADMGKMMKVAQEMQTKMSDLQDELRATMVVGESGAGKSRQVPARRSSPARGS